MLAKSSVPAAVHAASAITIAAAFMLGLACQAQTTTTYNVITQNKLAGKQVTSVAADGLVSVEFSYRENGRGPDIFEKITVRADGQMESFEATGKSTFGAPISETFKRIETGRKGKVSDEDLRAFYRQQSQPKRKRGILSQSSDLYTL